eukprot:COSAG01_NODE_10917_length_2051_cov_1.733607_1_plen_579_part_10
MFSRSAQLCALAVAAALGVLCPPLAASLPVGAAPGPVAWSAGTRDKLVATAGVRDGTVGPRDGPTCPVADPAVASRQACNAVEACGGPGHGQCTQAACEAGGCCWAQTASLLKRCYAPTNLPPPSGPSLDCSTKHFYLDILAYVTGICCTQDDPALCDENRGPFPSSFRNKRCALAMNQTSTACTPALAPFLNSGFNSQELCIMEAAKVQSDMYASNATQPRWIPVNKPATAGRWSPTDVCGATLVSGDVVGAEDSLKGELTLQAPEGLMLELTFKTLWLPKGSEINIFDGSDSQAKQLVHSLSGTTPELRLQGAITSTGESLHIEHSDLGSKAGSPPGLARSYSADIRCKCASSDSCGQHKTRDGSDAPNGECKDGQCHCKPGFAGNTCEQDLCDAIDCNKAGHGICSQGICFCSGNYTGDFCETPPQCGPRTKSVKCNCDKDYTAASNCMTAKPTLTVTGQSAAGMSAACTSAGTPCYQEDGHENGKIRFCYGSSSTGGAFVIHYTGDGWQLDHINGSTCPSSSPGPGPDVTKIQSGSVDITEMFYNPDSQSRPPVSGWLIDGRAASKTPGCTEFEG